MSDPATYGADVAPALPAYLATFVRYGAAYLAGRLATSGILPAGMEAEVISAVLALAAVGWGVFTKGRTRKALADAIEAPAGRAK